jgi:hypothetical protein
MMKTAQISCAEAKTLFYEPGGLLLRSCLVPADRSHGQHLLTFQLGYLGIGEITVQIALEVTGAPPGIATNKPGFTTAVLSGIDLLDDLEEASRHQIPSVDLSYVTVPDGPVGYRYTVWGQPGGAVDDLRGELSIVISGQLPTLRVVTQTGATRRVRIPELHGDAFDRSPCALT